MYAMGADDVDGGMAVFTATHPRWSFARVEDGYVVEVAEKRPISDLATVGIYYWRKGSEYVRYVEQMIAQNRRVNGEFYVCPVYNEAIADRARIKPYRVERMWGLGTPEDLREYLDHA
jgi:dTDP-glucose pyrophosphorylase